VDLLPDVLSTRFTAFLHNGLLSQHSLVDPMSQTDRFFSLFALLRQYRNKEKLQAALEKL